MGYHHTLACDTCEETGPILRQSGGSVILVARVGDKLLTGDEGRDVWAEWLSEHRYHRLRILGEQEDPQDLWNVDENDATVASCPQCLAVDSFAGTVDQGRAWWRRCRRCGHVWGPAVRGAFISAPPPDGAPQAGRPALCLLDHDHTEACLTP